MPVSAGPLRADFDNGDLRCIRLGETEIVRRIYVAFQDRNWTARPWLLDEVGIDQGHDSFTVTYTARGTFDAEPFTWSVRITGASDGTIDFGISGRTDAAFLRNRLGLCVLHPMSLSGQRVLVDHASGGQEESEFPSEISPNQPFVDVRALSHEVRPGLVARVEMAGDVFESEDHRNWSDASFKTYCTPITLPFPVEVVPAVPIEQSVRITLEGDAPRVSPEGDDAGIVLTIGDQTSPLPRIGLQAHPVPLTEHEAALLARLRLDHLRIDVPVATREASEILLTAAAQARAVGCRLRVALIGGTPDDLARLVDDARSALDLVDCWNVFRPHEKVTGPAAIDAARGVLGPDAVIGGGTDLYFTELNREPPATSGLDVVNFSLNPQVHSFDDRTLVQNTATQRVVAENAPRLAGGAAISISPITLRPRSNPNATDPDSDVSNGPLPSSVDARQRTWFAAAWTTLSLASLAEAGTIDAVTYFETTGWRGVMEASTGSMDPVNFPSEPGRTYPVFDVLEAVSGFSRARHLTSSRPEVVGALVVEGESAARLLLANLDEVAHAVALRGHLEGSHTVPARSVTVIELPGGPHA